MGRLLWGRCYGAVAVATRPPLRPSRSGPAAHPRGSGRDAAAPGPPAAPGAGSGLDGTGGAAPATASPPGPAAGPEQPPSAGAVGAATSLMPPPCPVPSRSSMYYDEDGDLAHEFYEETIVTKNGRKRAKLKRIHKNLIPQGIVKLEHPRIHVDFPVIICEV